MIVFAALVLSAAGCEGAYSVGPARITLTDAGDLSMTNLRAAIGAMLEAGGFDDLGTDYEMIALTRHAAPERTGALRAERLLHEYTYLNERRNLRVIVTDYTDVARGRPSLAYEAPTGPFFEISLYEERLGGFSSAVHSFLAEIWQELKTLDAVVTLATPPTTDTAEYWRVTLSGLFRGILAWPTVFGVTVAVMGGISYGVLKRTPIPISVKRGLIARKVLDSSNARPSAAQLRR
jgi:hypothetical protein